VLHDCSLHVIRRSSVSQSVSRIESSSQLHYLSLSLFLLNPTIHHPKRRMNTYFLSCQQTPSSLSNPPTGAARAATKPRQTRHTDGGSSGLGGVGWSRSSGFSSRNRARIGRVAETPGSLHGPADPASARSTNRERVKGKTDKTIRDDHHRISMKGHASGRTHTVASIMYSPTTSQPPFSFEASNRSPL
jgi:hypothetical protein